MAPANDGWQNEDRVYTVIKNMTKNSKVVLSNLNGIEIGPGQTLDLRDTFRKSQVIDAGHEIGSLIKSGHLADVGEGAENRPVAAATSTAPSQDELKKKMKDAILRDISDSTNMSQLEDWMNSPDQDVAKASKLRVDILLGNRNDEGEALPGADETPAKPTELIRNGVAIQEPVGAGAVRRVE